MKRWSEVKKELKAKGIEIKRVKATLNGAQAYRVISDEYNPASLWTQGEIIERYMHGEM